jgi:hypothetical protein
MSTISVYKSKYGYHPCDYRDFLVLKEFHWLAYLDMRASRRHFAWVARLPHNRIGGEPSKAVFLVPHYGLILEVYRNARMPASSPEEVKPILMWDELMAILGRLRDVYPGRFIDGRCVT